MLERYFFEYQRGVARLGHERTLKLIKTPNKISFTVKLTGYRCGCYFVIARFGDIILFAALGFAHGLAAQCFDIV